MSLPRIFASVCLAALAAGTAWAAPTFAPPYSGIVPSDELIKQPVTTIFPGAIPVNPDIKNPLADDPNAAERGFRDFTRFNCIGCHANNGGGGMGPSLSNDKWIYGASPAQIYLTILQGRPNGMPAWGSMLPDKVIWELVSYIKGITETPKSFGKTTSRVPQSPAIEQVPADKLTTLHPWDYTEPFSNGQRPPG